MPGQARKSPAYGAPAFFPLSQLWFCWVPSCWVTLQTRLAQKMRPWDVPFRFWLFSPSFWELGWNVHPPSLSQISAIAALQGVRLPNHSPKHGNSNDLPTPMASSTCVLKKNCLYLWRGCWVNLKNLKSIWEPGCSSASCLKSLARRSRWIKNSTSGGAFFFRGKLLKYQPINSQKEFGWF